MMNKINIKYLFYYYVGDFTVDPLQGARRAEYSLERRTVKASFLRRKTMA